SSLVTASIGIAVTRVSARVAPASLVAAADRALYRAKALGRDRVTVALEGGCCGFPAGSPGSLPRPEPRVPVSAR
ncbi:MAG: GGDEF domain-containing protein, partial [Actinomycetales bacterium]|nr:GGDEF domain-containing protein [Actinomycetales bacterium]